jgi:hypothetical protein
MNIEGKNFRIRNSLFDIRNSFLIIYDPEPLSYNSLGEELQWSIYFSW